MSQPTDFFISNEQSVPHYDGIKDYPETDVVRTHGITPLEAAGLLEALRGEGDRIEMLDEFPLLTPEEAEMWTVAVPDDFVTKLAALDENRTTAVAEKFCSITIEELNCSTEDILPLVRELTNLSRRAQHEKMNMYLWMSL